MWEACDEGWNNGSMSYAGITSLPGGTTFTFDYDSTNNNVFPTSPLMLGLPSALTGSYASHEYFSSLPGNATVYMTNSINSPTLAEYSLGYRWVF